MKKRRGFTLSELLVVVVIIGVLSAVVLPKFSKVIETRKTTEAEELMSAVRTEQEARCTLSKKYADISTLGSYKAGKNFSYSNEENHVGIIATASNNKYRLEMPSYADGRICCSDVTEGSKECEKLNKNYPLCSDLTNKSKTPDYVAGNADCGVEIEPGPNPEPEPPVINPCPADHPMVPAYTDEEGCTVTTSWELKDYPTCWVATETKSNCPVCTPGKKEVSSCLCGVEKGKICKSDGSGWDTYDNGTCELTNQEKSTCACETKPDARTCTACGETWNAKCLMGRWTFLLEDCASYDSCHEDESCVAGREEVTEYYDTDTCDGDKNTKFSCDLYMGTEKKECIDIYSVGGSSSSSSSDCSGDSWGAGGHECHTGADCAARTGKYNYPWKCVCYNHKYTCMVDTGSGGGIPDGNGHYLQNPIGDSYNAEEPGRQVTERVVCCPQSAAVGVGDFFTVQFD